MQDEQTFLKTLAKVFEYPDAATPEACSKAARVAGSKPLAKALEALGAWASEDPKGCEERYTQLFDMSPKCTLHIGYHLFGEDYMRGLILAKLRMELREVGVDGGEDLPDFLPTLLRLLAKLEDGEDRGLLVHYLLAPGLTKMGDELKDVDVPYAVILRELPDLLRSRRFTPILMDPQPELRA